MTARRPLLLRTASADAGSPSPIVLRDAGDDGIPYAVGRVVVVLGSNGRRVVTWHSPTDGEVDVAAIPGGAVPQRAEHLHSGASAPYDRRGLAWTSGRTLCWATALYADGGPHPHAPGC